MLTIVADESGEMTCLFEHAFVRATFNECHAFTINPRNISNPPKTQMSIKRVAIIGVTSRIGPNILAELEASSLFTLITILQRESSKSIPPHSSSTKVTTLPNDYPSDAVVSALRGHDALISALPGSAVEPHKHLADACIEAGVKRFIPADYGSVDSSDSVVAALVPLYKQKTAVREYLTDLSSRHPEFSWTSLVCGHFFDYGLQTELLAFNVPQRTAEIFDGGDAKWSASTLTQIGKAVVGVLRKPEETRNKMLYIQSFCVSQNEVLVELEKAAGGKFEVTQLSSEEYIKGKKVAVDQGDRDATEQMVAVLGLTRADWTSEKEFANELLGLKEEDLGEVVKKTYDAL